MLHHIDASLLEQTYDWMKRDAAPSVDGMTCSAYREGLQDRLRDLEARIHRGFYRAQPSRRAYISKPDGPQRPLGIAALEDRSSNVQYEPGWRSLPSSFTPIRRA